MGPREILPGLLHWTAAHPKIHVEVSSYWIAAPRVLLDPLLPDGGVEGLRALGTPAHVILTNRHHWRHCSEIVAAFDCPVWCNARGLHEVESEPGADHVRGFEAGEGLPGGIESYEVGVLCPDETALRIPLAGSACLAVADGVVRMGEQARGDGPLAFVPDVLIADTPEAVAAVKQGLRAAYRRLLDLDWDTLLLAHGLPLVGDGREQLRAFVEE